MMKTQFSKSVITSVITAGIFAILAQFLPFLSDYSPAILLALGALIGGGMVALINREQNTTPTPSQLSTQTLYVGNLPYRANETAVRELFSQYGHVVSVRLLKDKQTGKRRGFGFVEMADEGAFEAIEALNDQEYQDRTLKVRPANERKDKESA
jgi:hypothetical protein